MTFQLSHKHGAVQFAQVVSENVPAFDQAFWLRIASRADAAPAGEKEQLQALASTTMGLVDSMMKETESQLESGGQVVQDILKAGANENGEWTVPLAASQIDAMRQVRVHTSGSQTIQRTMHCYTYIFPAV